MKRSLQEYVELVVFGLIAVLVGTGLLWLLGWVLSLGGIVLKGLAGLLWMLLRFVVPVAIAGGLVYFLVKAAQDRQKPAPVTAGGGTAAPPHAPDVIDVAPAAAPVAAATQTATEVSDAVAASGTATSDMVVDTADAVAASTEDAAGAVADEVDVIVADAAADAAAEAEAAAEGAADAVAEATANADDEVEDDESETNA